MNRRDNPPVAARDQHGRAIRHAHRRHASCIISHKCIGAGCFAAVRWLTPKHDMHIGRVHLVYLNSFATRRVDALEYRRDFAGDRLRCISLVRKQVTRVAKVQLVEHSLRHAALTRGECMRDAEGGQPGRCQQEWGGHAAKRIFAIRCFASKSRNDDTV